MFSGELGGPKVLLVSPTQTKPQANDSQSKILKVKNFQFWGDPEQAPLFEWITFVV